VKDTNKWDGARKKNAWKVLKVNSQADISLQYQKQKTSWKTT